MLQKDAAWASNSKNTTKNKHMGAERLNLLPLFLSPPRSRAPSFLPSSLPVCYILCSPPRTWETNKCTHTQQKLDGILPVRRIYLGYQETKNDLGCGHRGRRSVPLDTFAQPLPPTLGPPARLIVHTSRFVSLPLPYRSHFRTKTSLPYTSVSIGCAENKEEDATASHRVGD